MHFLRLFGEASIARFCLCVEVDLLMRALLLFAMRVSLNQLNCR